jgi:hypothetical protein
VNKNRCRGAGHQLQTGACHFLISLKHTNYKGFAFGWESVMAWFTLFMLQTL